MRSSSKKSSNRMLITSAHKSPYCVPHLHKSPFLFFFYFNLPNPIVKSFNSFDQFYNFASACFSLALAVVVVSTARATATATFALDLKFVFASQLTPTDRPFQFNQLRAPIQISSFVRAPLLTIVGPLLAIVRPLVSARTHTGQRHQQAANGKADRKDRPQPPEPYGFTSIAHQTTRPRGRSFLG